MKEVWITYNFLTKTDGKMKTLNAFKNTALSQTKWKADVRIWDILWHVKIFDLKK